MTGAPQVGPAPASGHRHVPEKGPPRYRLAYLGRGAFYRLGDNLKTLDGPDHKAWAEETGARPSLSSRLVGPGIGHGRKGRRRGGDFDRAQFPEEAKGYVPLALRGPAQPVHGRPRQSGKSRDDSGSGPDGDKAADHGAQVRAARLRWGRLGGGCRQARWSQAGAGSGRGARLRKAVKPTGSPRGRTRDTGPRTVSWLVFWVQPGLLVAPAGKLCVRSRPVA